MDINPIHYCREINGLVGKIENANIDHTVLVVAIEWDADL